MTEIHFLRALAGFGVLLNMIAVVVTLYPIARAKHSRPMLKTLFFIACLVLMWAVAVLQLFLEIPRMSSFRFEYWAVWYAPVMPIGVAALLIWLGTHFRKRIDP